MALRRDALVEAAAFVLRVRAAARDDAADGRAPDRGARREQRRLRPGSAFLVDARAPSAAALDRLVEAIGFVPSERSDPVVLDPGLLGTLRAVLPDAPAELASVRRSRRRLSPRWPRAS